MAKCQVLWGRTVGNGSSTWGPTRSGYYVVKVHTHSLMCEYPQSFVAIAAPLASLPLCINFRHFPKNALPSPGISHVFQLLEAVLAAAVVGSIMVVKAGLTARRLVLQQQQQCGSNGSSLCGELNSLGASFCLCLHGLRSSINSVQLLICGFPYSSYAF